MSKQPEGTLLEGSSGTLTRDSSEKMLPLVGSISRVSMPGWVLTHMGTMPDEGLSEAHATVSLGGIGYGASAALERHYRPDELAETWGLSVKVIRQIFSSENGVLKMNRPETRNKRGYCTMRIPESVVVRVHKRLTAGSR